MKKRFLAIMACFIIGTVCVSAQENTEKTDSSGLEYGINFGAGVETSFILKPYIYESTSFMIKPTENFSADLGVRVLFNTLKSSKEPLVYLLPTFTITFHHFYLGGGAFIDFTDSNSEDNSNSIVSWQVRAGAVFGNWEWGPGIGNVDIGLSFSPTVIIAETSESDNEAGAALGAAIGSIFLTIFNIVKLNVGVTWFLPL